MRSAGSHPDRPRRARALRSKPRRRRPGGAGGDRAGDGDRPDPRAPRRPCGRRQRPGGSGDLPCSRQVRPLRCPHPGSPAGGWHVLSMALSTVSRWLARIGLGKRSRLSSPEPPNRYERKRPGELIHVDIKKLGRISAKGAGTASPVSGAEPGEAQRERWAAPSHRLGVRPRLRRRCDPTGLRGGLA